MSGTEHDKCPSEHWKQAKCYQKIFLFIFLNYYFLRNTPSVSTETEHKTFQEENLQRCKKN